ncbi:hypothetical protein BLOT_009096 [Blomia tropicalis]|nr:hypothetical protein BLOT_009096 [Blomia tropicalis]
MKDLLIKTWNTSIKDLSLFNDHLITQSQSLAVLNNMIIYGYDDDDDSKESLTNANNHGLYLHGNENLFRT